ncbi:CheR family methyltransferase [uncultured Thomasclavelia sp.]|uniref:CheR family methyltransferase n=1 Tax=uncultured Thomasclavelia sp. TaxID=3025759 RepID=UPI0025ED19B9|nr:CheR family methyltransferase [uncultured Thomasclavelia sp.]
MNNLHSEESNEQKKVVASKHYPMIIGIGASAGGLEALQQFFEAMPGNSGLSFVVVQHLSPDYKSLMADILSKHTDMEVIQAENEMNIEPNTVYLIPPKNNMTLQGNKLILTEYVHGILNHPIDIFFTSLAKVRKERSAAVVLSGTGTDGTKGIKSIKENGGLVIVQDPSCAKFDGMPKSAISTGIVDWILSPKEIAEEILNFSSYPTIFKNHESEEFFSDEEIFSHICNVLKKVSGIDFTNYKRTTVLRRIERRMVVNHSASFHDYAHSLDTNVEEAKILVKEILIGVTNFFRDASAFEKLKQAVIRRLVENTKENESIRVWSAGCSTGEEAYSIAILFQEVMEELQVERNIKIFATDVDVSAIEKAGKGIFSESILDDVSSERLAKYFTKKNDSYHISKSIRRMIIFAPHNMLSDPPFGKLDLISCRNVMIYFQPVLQRGLFAIFHSALKDGGYLFLGKSETANECSNVFRPYHGEEKIYIHKGGAKLETWSPSSYNVPNIQPHLRKTSHINQQQHINYSLENIYTQYLERFLPASVVIDNQDNVIHFFGNYSDYLTIAPGKATFNLFSMLDKNIGLAASTALNRCREEHRSVTYTGIPVSNVDGVKQIDLIIEPIDWEHKDEYELIVVIFVDKRNIETDGIKEKYDIDASAARRISDLEQELHESQNDLKSTIGELETVNEELQAANEELLTANEELQSSNEELQSVNEELYTVNAEYQQKLDEMTIMTNDLSNFLSSTMIGILFVDGNLNIRKFTEYIGREFQLMEPDIGRSIQIFAHSFPQEDIVEDANSVLRTLVPVDREVTAMNGRYYTLRIAPYRTTENRIKGLVITIIDSLGGDNKK